MDSVAERKEGFRPGCESMACYNNARHFQFWGSRLMAADAEGSLDRKRKKQKKGRRESKM